MSARVTQQVLVRWCDAAQAALAENGIRSTPETEGGKVELRTTTGAVVTAWATRSVVAGGREPGRSDAVSVLLSAGLVVGEPRGKLLLAEPQEPAPEPAGTPNKVERRIDALEARLREREAQIVALADEIRALRQATRDLLPSAHGAGRAGLLAVEYFDRVSLRRE